MGKTGNKIKLDRIKKGGDEILMAVTKKIHIHTSYNICSADSLFGYYNTRPQIPFSYMHTYVEAEEGYSTTCTTIEMQISIKFPCWLLRSEYKTKDYP